MVEKKSASDSVFDLLDVLQTFKREGVKAIAELKAGGKPVTYAAQVHTIELDGITARVWLLDATPPVLVGVCSMGKAAHAVVQLVQPNSKDSPEVLAKAVATALLREALTTKEPAP